MHVDKITTNCGQDASVKFTQRCIEYLGGIGVNLIWLFKDGHGKMEQDGPTFALPLTHLSSSYFQFLTEIYSMTNGFLPNGSRSWRFFGELLNDIRKEKTVEMMTFVNKMDHNASIKNMKARYEKLLVDKEMFSEVNKNLILRFLSERVRSISELNDTNQLIVSSFELLRLLYEKNPESADEIIKHIGLILEIVDVPSSFITVTEPVPIYTSFITTLKQYCRMFTEIRPFPLEILMFCDYEESTDKAVQQRLVGYSKTRGQEARNWDTWVAQRLVNGRVYEAGKFKFWFGETENAIVVPKVMDQELTEQQKRDLRSFFKEIK